MKCNAMHAPWQCLVRKVHSPYPASSFVIYLLDPVPDLLSAQVFSKINLSAPVNHGLSHDIPECWAASRI